MRLFKQTPPKSSTSHSSEGDGKGIDKAAYERRREQVRKAQRNHRERRANYVKALEQEVANLRKQNQQNIRELEAEIQRLHSFLSDNGLTPPTRQARIIQPATGELDANAPSSFTVSKAQGTDVALQLEIPPNIASGGRQQASPGDSLSPAGQSGSSPSDLSQAGTASSSAPSISQKCPANQIDTIYGVNFILALEHNCVGHPTVTRNPTGTHSHMATSNLLSYAPSNLDANVAAPADWQVPGASIEQLLALSTTFQLQGEITPVQAWFRLKADPRFDRITEAHLQQLKELLVSDAKCFGFGVVIEEQLWQVTVDFVLSQTAG